MNEFTHINRKNRTDDGKESNRHLFCEVCYVVGVSHREGILPQVRDSVKGGI